MPPILIPPLLPLPQTHINPNLVHAFPPSPSRRRERKLDVAKRAVDFVAERGGDDFGEGVPAALAGDLDEGADADGLGGVEGGEGAGAEGGVGGVGEVGHVGVGMGVLCVWTERGGAKEMRSRGVMD